MRLNLIVIFCVISLTLSLEYKNCKTIICGAGNSTSQCVSVSNDNNTVTVDWCSDGYSCPNLNQFANTTGIFTPTSCRQDTLGNNTDTFPPNITLIMNGTLATGEACQNGDQCISQICAQGVCEGISQGSDCVVDDECQTGFYCGTGIVTNSTSGNGTNVTNVNGTNVTSGNETNTTIGSNNTNTSSTNATNTTGGNTTEGGSNVTVTVNGTNITVGGNITTGGGSNVTVGMNGTNITVGGNITTGGGSNVTVDMNGTNITVGGNITNITIVSNNTNTSIAANLTTPGSLRSRRLQEAEPSLINSTSSANDTMVISSSDTNVTVTSTNITIGGVNDTNITIGGGNDTNLTMGGGNGTNITIGGGNDTNITIGGWNGTNITIGGVNGTNITMGGGNGTNITVTTNGTNITITNTTAGGNATQTNATNGTIPNTTGGNSTNGTQTTGSTLGRVCLPALSENESCLRDEQCEAGLGCNLGMCSPYWSVPVGSSASDESFCVSNFLRNGTCSGIEIYVDSVKLVFPFACNISDVCSYQFADSSEVWRTDKCQCDGMHNETGYCDLHGQVLGFWDVVYPKFKYSSSSCSGARAHSKDLNVLNECGSLPADAISYYEAMQEEADAWTLYQSGAINTCAKQIQLFDPSMNLNSYSSDSATILLVSFLVLVFN